MPIFEIQGPDGSVYEVDAPDENAAVSGFKQFGGGQQPPQSGGFLNTVSDVLASGASGMARGAADLAGIPGSLGDLARTGLEGGLRKGYELATGEVPSADGGAVERFFAGPSPEVLAQLPRGGAMPMSGATLREGLSDLTLGATDYQPQTTAGEYARTGGEFLPGAVAFGGLSPFNLLRTAVAPAVASETAGQVTKDTAFEPYARVAGALVGGVAGNRLGRPAAEKLPTAAEIKGSAGYSQLREPMKQAKLEQGNYQNIVDDLWKEAGDFGLTTKLRGEFGGVLNDFTKRAEQGGASLFDLELLRRSLRNAAGDKLDDASQALSARLVDKLDDAVDGLSASSIQAAEDTGTPILDVLKEARQTYRTGAKSQTIETAIARAQNAASGVENGLRTEFRKILNNPKQLRNFNEAERTAIQQVVKGNFTTNALRWLGTFGVPIDQGRNFLGSLSGGGVGATIGGLIGGPAGATVGGFALPAIGTAAKAGASRATQEAATVAEALVKGGPDASRVFSEALSSSQQASREAILRALLQSSQAVGQVPTYLGVPR